MLDSYHNGQLRQPISFLTAANRRACRQLPESERFEFLKELLADKYLKSNSNNRARALKRDIARILLTI
jgi:ribosomal protein L29